jgi:hypothetical protein
VEGTIPAELQGTYFRNGPGLQVSCLSWAAVMAYMQWPLCYGMHLQLRRVWRHCSDLGWTCVFECMLCPCGVDLRSDGPCPSAWLPVPLSCILSGGPLQVNNPNYKRHTFDGDGMVLSFSFQGGRVRFRNKYVRTQGFLDEQVRGHVRGACRGMCMPVQG